MDVIFICFECLFLAVVLRGVVFIRGRVAVVVVRGVYNVVVLVVIVVFRYIILLVIVVIALFLAYVYILFLFLFIVLRNV